MIGRGAGGGRGCVCGRVYEEGGCVWKGGRCVEGGGLEGRGREGGRERLKGILYVTDVVLF